MRTGLRKYLSTKLPIFRFFSLKGRRTEFVWKNFFLKYLINKPNQRARCNHITSQKCEMVTSGYKVTHFVQVVNGEGLNQASPSVLLHFSARGSFEMRETI